MVENTWNPNEYAFSITQSRPHVARVPTELDVSQGTGLCLYPDRHTQSLAPSMNSVVCLTQGK